MMIIEYRRALCITHLALGIQLWFLEAKKLWRAIAHNCHDIASTFHAIVSKKQIDWEAFGMPFGC